ncbi:hypothetical protein [Paenibacillus piri]|uniref:Family 2 glycosyl transferase n=1 Tax=Paenibacillus piri TaxID=2547395 RepID=A0A4V2ZSP4_9BACL|nr:hypothetical protein [Paenibacillus piri]TDF93854.1 hypothetical protein E1757_26080 [Paenibacillus piri]
MKSNQIIRIVLGVLAFAAICVVIWIFVIPDKGPGGSRAALAVSQPIHEEQGIKQIASVQDGRLAVYDGSAWKPQFWSGVNLGATTPGHAPGELSPSKDDYLRWFAQMKAMNVNVLRVYTILPPYFYEALAEFNSGQKQPLYFFQGVWSPDEELMDKDGRPRDAWADQAVKVFQNEIRDVVKAVHGDLKRKTRPGHASGSFTTDVSAYLVGWVVGTEWDPHVVKTTNDAHSGKMKPFAGNYFQADAEASPFESWLAQMLDTLAQEEMKYGWQHPVSFTNWVTTDPLQHPNEPSDNEDLVSVDPMHVAPAGNWKAGYFASYHVYPYYPDFLRYEEKYQTYKDASGQVNPYAGYLHDLREYHKGIPLIVAEYGVPSSRGMAHFGPLGRNQGMHTEEEQGKIDADLYNSIYNEGYDGALLFAWADEWFKITWNTTELDAPAARRPFWRNMLTNEEHFGVVAVEAGKSPDDQIMLDGKMDDWNRRKDKITQMYPGFSLTASHDEAYVYLLLQKKDGTAWQPGKETLAIGFDTLPGGSKSADRVPGVTFSAGQEFVLRLKADDDAHIFVNSAYDQHTWLYGSVQKMMPWQEQWGQDNNGIFLPWKLPVSKPLKLPQTGQTIPFEDVEIGVLNKGITDPASDQYNSLADWYAEGPVMEIRIPWMLLGFTDPSTGQVWRYPYEAKALKMVEAKSIKIEPHLQTQGDGSETASGPVEPLNYKWNHWEKPEYHERLKKSYDVLKEAFGSPRPPKELR